MKYLNIGTPFETDSIVDFENIRPVESLSDLLDGTGLSCDVKDVTTLTYKFDSNDKVYGLGENLRGINKRGGIYESFCTDDPNHTPDKRALYGAHNFFIVDGKKSFGVYIDFPTYIEFDFGFSHKDELKVSIEGKDLRLYIIEGDKKTIVSKFLKAIGPSFLPPKWAFGFQQSRWSYPDNKAIREIADKFIESDIPCDTIYMDIDYMKDFKNFTIDEERFPNFESFVKDLKDDGFRLIPIIDAGCKIEDGYKTHEEGVKNRYYCEDSEGKPFVGAVWPGLVHFPDFINPEARKWFGDQYDFLIDKGIEGFWNDMNEPAIFYSAKKLEEAIEYASNQKGKNLGIYDFFKLKDQFMWLSNNKEDYQSFYHRVDGNTYNHYDLHNLFGYNMTRAAGEAFERNHPEKRILLFSRASYIGMHRYGGIWTGDNHAWWEHLTQNIKMMPSLNMCGFLYSGADIGGFGGNASGELATRWSQFAVYTPLFRNHACMGSRHQEPFSFEDDTTQVTRDIIRYRYAFITYLYSEFMKARTNNTLLFRPLSFDFEDEHCHQVEDQLMYGSGIMLAPVHQANAKGRYVYLPEKMLEYKIKSNDNYALELRESGHQYVQVQTKEWLNYLRQGTLLILNEVKNKVEDISVETLDLIGFVDKDASYQVYSDDGISRDAEASYFDIHVKYDGQIHLSHTGDIGCKEISYDIVTTDNKRHKGVYHV
ncbi:alpha-glucosidase [Acidaminobacter sp. JC074]|uniref:glycoside hydrolase family 31 protein n=1 Tax=Acidaminobacter sp. JC074 TaxID=2530199 RepID=UPI001F109524|nr:TIM-barrel domain-containing protein [Acidaminobacter sp. JC074]MCH4888287.1 alpha-glucosidase [Acidaminobacter sp. JC074]